MVLYHFSIIEAASSETAGGLFGVHESAIVVLDSPVFKIG